MTDEANNKITTDAAVARLRWNVTPRAFTIAQWCAMRGYSRPFFYNNLRKNKNIPDLIGTGKAQRITVEADARWLKRQEKMARDMRKAAKKAARKTRASAA